MSDEEFNILVAVIFTIVLLIYFIPTIVGWKRSFAFEIFLLNLLLGWTVLGWIIALIWAIGSKRRNNISRRKWK